MDLKSRGGEAGQDSQATELLNMYSVLYIALVHLGVPGLFSQARFAFLLSNAVLFCPAGKPSK